MIKVVLFERVEEIDHGHTFYVDTGSFVMADKAARLKAKELGIDLNRICNTAMATIEVLKPGG